MGSLPKLRHVTQSKQLEAALFATYAGFVTLWVATKFFGSLRLQTLYAEHWAVPAAFERLVQNARGPWSAPLDDVFIHFDFARAAARGHPFQWSEGNGYSSGGTSLLYPFVLAAGYWWGFRGLSLMEWAGIVACVCTFGSLLLARRLLRQLPLFYSYLLPLGLLCVGALDWSLFSGMEIALFLGLWSLAYAASDDLASATNEERWLPKAMWLGACSALVTATRPEGVMAAAVLALNAVLPLRQRASQRAVTIFAIALAPAALVTGAQAIANLIYTGETTAAGALVKLELHHPYLSRQQVWDSWLFFLKYQLLRNTQYHFSDRALYGWIVWVFAALCFVFPRTRRAGAVLFASALSWVALVALNGQVRWQNDRYTMPAVAWVLLMATLGVAATLDYAMRFRTRVRGPLLGLAVVTGIALFVFHQTLRFQEQLWFYGRAARNILDQHIQAAFLMRSELDPPVKRVLVGDAGAIPYISDLPALDVIGLGGYHGLPFARATREHIGAGIELIERMPPAERPDLLAIYPSWWGDFPLWFGQPIAQLPVRGNVICGGPSKVLYRPDWSSLKDSDKPFSLRPGERVLDALDEADLVNEREHHYRLSGAPGFVAMKLLTSPADGHPLWDAGRVIPPAASETFHISGLARTSPSLRAQPGGLSATNHRVRLIVRAAPSERTALQVAFDGRAQGELVLEPNGGWVEGSLDGLSVQSDELDVSLGKSNRERIAYHVFIVAGP